MYHTHWHDALQLKSGMYGPLIVLPPKAEYDTETERLVILSSSPPAPGVPEPLLVNGAVDPPAAKMHVGNDLSHPMYQHHAQSRELLSCAWHRASSQSNGATSPRMVPDLPPAQIVDTKEALSLAVGETRDFEYQPKGPGNLRVEVRLPNGALRTKIDIEVR
jgi:hypothetical protein